MMPAFGAPVVCNAGPLISLARIGMAHLPFDLFAEVMVPEEVRVELLAKDSADRAQLEEALERARIIRSATRPDRLLLMELDAGEAAVIHVALESGASSVILDERKARRIASHVYGLRVKGTAGLLVEAKSKGLIERVAPCLDGMIQGGYFLGPGLVAACLSAAGES